MTDEDFALRLAVGSRSRLGFDHVAALTTDRLKDIGDIPTEGDATTAMARLVEALPATRDQFQCSRILLYDGVLAHLLSGPSCRRGARGV